MISHKVIGMGFPRIAMRISMIAINDLFLAAHEQEYLVLIWVLWVLCPSGELLIKKKAVMIFSAARPDRDGIGV